MIWVLQGIREKSGLKMIDAHKRLPVQIGVKLSTVFYNHLTELLNRWYGKTIDLLLISGNLQFGEPNFHVRICLFPGRYWK